VQYPHGVIVIMSRAIRRPSLSYLKEAKMRKEIVTVKATCDMCGVPGTENFPVAAYKISTPTNSESGTIDLCGSCYAKMSEAILVLKTQISINIEYIVDSDYPVEEE